MGTVVLVSNPFHPERGRDAVAVPQPVTVRGWLDARSIREFERPTICLLNDRALLRAEWATAVIGERDVVAFVALPHGGGGGGGGKNPLSTVLTIAIMVAAPELGGLIAAEFGVTATWGIRAISAGVALAGAALVNVLVPPPRPSVPAMSWGGGYGNTPAASPTYSLQAQGNEARLSQPIPVVYGRHMVYPDLAATPYEDYANNEQVLHQLHCIGQGEYDVEQVRIEDTPISSFEEVEVEIVPPGQSVTLFDPNVVTAPEVAGQELKSPNQLQAGEGGWVGPFAANPVDTEATEIWTDIVLPRGLYYANDSGGLAERSVSWEVQARLIDAAGIPAGEWQTLGTETLTLATNTAQRLTKKYPVAAGRYEVRARRLDDKDTSARAGHEVRWFGLAARIAGETSFGDITLLAVKMRATDNLSQRSSRLINCIVTRKLPVWSPTSGWSAPQPTRSIAWAVADALKATYGAGLADARIDVAGLHALDEVWSARGDTFDAVFDASLTVWEAATRIARCGRAVPIQQGGVVRLVRDQPQSLPVALFGPRNIARGSFKIQYVMPGEDTADAVTVEYFSSRTWKPAEVTVNLPDSAQAKPAKVSLFGCTGKDHAEREGLYMAAANRFRRRLVTFRTELEGLIPTYGDLIAVVHDMPRWGQGGEVVAWDGTTLVVSEPLEWTEGAAHYLALRRGDGSVAGPFPVAPGETSDRVVPQAPLDVEPYLGGESERTHYAFGPGEAWSLPARVLTVRPRGERVEIWCVGEDARIHEASAAA